MGKIRVLHVLHSMNRGGAENALMNYYRNIDRSKIQFDFLLTECHKSSFEDEIISMGGRVYRIPLLTMLNPFKYIRGLQIFLKSHPEYKIIHSHTSSKSFFPLYIAKKMNIPVRISHSHSSMAEKGINGIIRKILRPLLKTVATDWLSCGIQAGIYLYGHKAQRDGKVMIFRNVIEANRYCYSIEVRKSIRKILGILDDTYIIGHTARFDPVKNHKFDIDILVEAKKIYPNTKLLEIGLGVEEGMYKYAKERNVLNDIIFTGVINNVWDYEQAMDAFILPSLNEGLPLSIVEAQVSGLPCFTTLGGVSSECRITDLVTFIQLEAGAAVWAQHIMNSRNYIRKSHLNEMIMKGYDAATSASQLQEFYIERFIETS